MKTLHSFAAVLVFSAAPLLSARAADATPKPAPAAAPAESTTVIAADDLGQLRGMVGQKVTIEGTIDSSSAAKSGTVRYLNFSKTYKSSVSLVFFLKNNPVTKEQLDEFAGKKVRVSGPLSEHDGSLQIIVNALDEVKVQ